MTPKGPLAKDFSFVRVGVWSLVSILVRATLCCTSSRFWPFLWELFSVSSVRLVVMILQVRSESMRARSGAEVVAIAQPVTVVWMV